MKRIFIFIQLALISAGFAFGDEAVQIEYIDRGKSPLLIAGVIFIVVSAILLIRLATEKPRGKK